MKSFISVILTIALLTVFTAGAYADTAIFDTDSVGSGLNNFDFVEIPTLPDTAPTIEAGDLSYNPGEVPQIPQTTLPTLDVDGVAFNPGEIPQIQSEIAEILLAELGYAGIPVRMDPSTGAIALDSSLLYAKDADQVTDSGKAVLQKVMQVICSVLMRDEYRDSIACVLIAGHTDSDGSHEYNQELSERRANGVKDFCLSGECGLDTDQMAWLNDVLIAQGYSYDYRIFNADGTENMDASRRVEIRFAVK